MIQYKHDLNTSTGIKILIQFLGRNPVIIRIPEAHQVDRKELEVL